MKRVKNWIFGGLLAVMLAGGALAADLQKGLDAYESGDYATALAEWKPLAEAGDAVAQYNLGQMYRQGKGVPQDYEEAVKWYRLVTDAKKFYGVSAQFVLGKFYVVSAQYFLGEMYRQGGGIPQDYEEAVKWYRLAAEAENNKYSAHAHYTHSAQFYLGVMYDSGRGVEQDFAEAVRWWRLAAEAGDSPAQYNLGVMYDSGRGVEQDFAEAVRWWHLAAEAGHDGARYNLGNMYANGKGVPQDYAEAVKLYRLAAGNMYVSAQYNLGVMYAKGNGVLQDDRFAYMWFNIATAQGHDLAKVFRDIVAETMTPAQRSEAQEMSRQCLAQNYKNCEQLAP